MPTLLLRQELDLQSSVFADSLLTHLIIPFFRKGLDAFFLNSQLKAKSIKIAVSVYNALMFIGARGEIRTLDKRLNCDENEI